MKKDEIIVLLKEQLQLANEQLQQANATVSSLTTQVNELIERIKSLEELLVQKGIAIDKANRQNKALGKLVSGKKSERQEKNPQASMTQEEFDKKKTEQAEKRKERKNNGAKRDMHCEMEEVHVTIDPVMDAEFLKTLRLFGTRTCVRYSMEPIKFIKTVYHINTYTDGSILYPEDFAGSVVEFFLFTFLCCRSPADAIHLFHAGGANHQILCRQWVYVKEGHGKQADCQKCRCTGKLL